MTFLWILVGIAAVFLLTVFWGAPYVPSRKSDVKRAFSELYSLGKKDVVVDIGSGDGIVLRQAAERGAQAVGFEINPVLVLISKFLCRRYEGVSVKRANFWRATLPKETTVVYVFGEGRDINKMGDWAQKQAELLGKTIYFISYGFELKKHTPIKRIGPHLLYLFNQS